MSYILGVATSAAQGGMSVSNNMRRYDWVEKMWHTIDAHINQDFRYGELDCCIFAARVVDAMCDTKHEELLRTHYSDEDTALAYIEINGGLQEAVSTYLGKSCDGRAQRGDVVMFRGELGETIGICVGPYIASVYRNGIVFLQRDNIICRWVL